MTRLRILVLGPNCHPERVSIPFVTYSHAAALAKLHDVTLAVREGVAADVRDAGAPFRAVEAIRMRRTESIHAWACHRFLRGNFNSQWRTVFAYPVTAAFEWNAWCRFRHRIRAGEFDVVMRIEPLSATAPSPFARFLRRGPIPFIVGPVNGGLPWPAGFPQVARARERVSALRNAYRYLPFGGSTYRHASAILAASSQTCSEFSRYADKVFFIPENGIGAAAIAAAAAPARGGAALELLFAGGLVARKACDLALRGAASQLRRRQARLTVIGDGPDRHKLQDLALSLGVAEQVEFTGWLTRAEVIARMRAADIFVFPSIRDFGGGVVFEALASGAVPVVADFGGPGDIVNDEVGFRVPLTNERDLVAGIEGVLSRLANDRALLTRLREKGLAYAREQLTWEAKARDTSLVLAWVAGRGPKPDLPPPRRLGQLVDPLPVPATPPAGAPTVT